jgi:hypothetical protein
MTPRCFPPPWSVIEGRMAFQSILTRLRLWKETTSRKIQSQQAGQDWSSSFASNGEGNKRPVVSVPADDRRARCACVCEDSYSRRW